MGRKSREEKTIEHGEIVLDDLKKIYSEDSEAFVEYTKLFDEYKKLSKRFKKTLKVSDTSGKGVIDHNEQLKENIHYTVEKAKTKILYNIEEHRKTKETLAKVTNNESEIVGRLKRELKDLRAYTIKLEHELNKDGEIAHQFHETEDIIRPNEINPPNLHNKSFQKLITQYLEKGLFPTTIVKVTIDDFKDQYDQIKNLGSDKVSILKGFYKFFSSTIGAKHIVYYFGNNIFYIVLNKLTLKDSKEIIDSINKPRQISKITFTFSFHTVELQNESYAEFLKRIDQES